MPWICPRGLALGLRRVGLDDHVAGIVAVHDALADFVGAHVEDRGQAGGGLLGVFDDPRLGEDACGSDRWRPGRGRGNPGSRPAAAPGADRPAAGSGSFPRTGRRGCTAGRSTGRPGRRTRRSRGTCRTMHELSPAALAEVRHRSTFLPALSDCMQSHGPWSYRPGPRTIRTIEPTPAQADRVIRRACARSRPG